MILLRDFSEDTRIDRIWYESSMIVYSECYDDPNSRNKDLKVVFKNGGTYTYKGVDVDDYVMFVHGGLDGSNGKALNQFIKPKCEVIKEQTTEIRSLNNIKHMIEEEKMVKGQTLVVGDAVEYKSYVLNGTGVTIYDAEILEVIDDNTFKIKDLRNDKIQICNLYTRELWFEEKENPYNNVYSISFLRKKIIESTI